MAKNKTKDVRKKSKKKLVPKPTLSSKNSNLPVKLTKEKLDKLYTSVRDIGNISNAPAIFGVARSTIHTWNNKYKVLQDTVSHALTQHEKLRNREHPEFFTQAMSVVEIMIHDRKMVEVTTTRERLVTVPEDTDMDMTAEELEELEQALLEDDDFPSSKVIKETTKTRRYIREPNWAAIEKVLGKKDLRNIVMGIANNNITTRTNLIKKMFGKWSKSDDLGERWDGNMFNDMIDLMTLRTLQMDTRASFETGELTIEEYSKLVAEQAKTYGYIMHNRESRALKLLKGHSYSDLMDLFKAQIKNISNMVETVCSDVSINRKQIPDEVYNRLQDIPELKALTAWSNVSEV